MCVDPSWDFEKEKQKETERRNAKKPMPTPDQDLSKAYYDLKQQRLLEKEDIINTILFNLIKEEILIIQEEENNVRTS